MTGEPWLYAALAVLVAGHLLAAWYGATRQRHTGVDLHADGSDEPSDGVDASVGTADLVECPHCGTANERGYHRCRACIGELPGADGRVGGYTPARGRVFP